jgi:zona occludens toxin (predicted ATPase)
MAHPLLFHHRIDFLSPYQPFTHMRTHSLLLGSLALTLSACGGKSNGDTSTPIATTDSTLSQTQSTNSTVAVAPKHHSVLGGAVAGAAAGHMLGHHAIAGAAVGALVQHERNKH